MSKEPFLVAHIAQCKLCGDTIQSKHRHDYQCCSCGEICIDGGLDAQYGSWVKNPHNRVNKNVYSDAPIEKIREVLLRNGTTLLKDMSDDWLENCIEYEMTNRPDNPLIEVYNREIKFRIENNE